MDWTGVLEAGLEEMTQAGTASGAGIWKSCFLQAGLEAMTLLALRT
jgi:hypothetical protein